MIPKLGSANVYTDALFNKDELLGGEGILEPIIMLSNACHVVIDTKFAMKVCTEAKNK